MLELVFRVNTCARHHTVCGVSTQINESKPDKGRAYAGRYPTVKAWHRMEKPMYKTQVKDERSGYRFGETLARTTSEESIDGYINTEFEFLFSFAVPDEEWEQRKAAQKNDHEGKITESRKNNGRFKRFLTGVGDLFGKAPAEPIGDLYARRFSGSLGVVWCRRARAGSKPKLWSQLCSTYSIENRVEGSPTSRLLHQTSRSTCRRRN